jgi:hypothetical protein
LALPFYFVLVALTVTFTFVQVLNTFVFTAVYGICGLLSLSALIYNIDDAKIFRVLELIDDDEPKHLSEKAMLRKTRRKAAVMAVCVPFVLSGLVVFITTFAISSYTRFLEYVSSYVCFSVPLFTSGAFALLRKL